MPRRKSRADSPIGFTFIDISQPNDLKQAATQKAIRHHVMSRVGRSRRKLPRTVSLAIRSPRLVKSCGGGRSTPARDSWDVQAFWDRVPWSLHPYGIFPVHTSLKERHLINFMASDGNHLYPLFRADWFSLAVLDATPFYLSLANAALFFNQRINRASVDHGDFQESSQYLSLCLNMVAQKLGNEVDRVSDGVIATVVGLLCHDKSRIGNWTRWGVHMDGLGNILKIRGGGEGLHPTLLMSISWFDVVGSTVFDSPLRFPSINPPAFRPRPDSDLSPSLAELLVEMRYIDGLFDTANVLAATAQLANHVNSDYHSLRFWQDGATALTILAPIMHLLLPAQQAPTGSPTGRAIMTSILSEMIRLTLLMLVTSLNNIGAVLSIKLNTAFVKFKNLLDQALNIPSNYRQITLWAIVTVTLLIREEERTEHLEALRSVMRLVGIKGKEVIQVTKGLIWIGRLTDAGAGLLANELDYPSSCY